MASLVVDARPVHYALLLHGQGGKKRNRAGDSAHSFIDIVGYSKLLVDDERELQEQLNQVPGDK